MLGRVVVESLAVLLREHPAVRATKAIRAEVNLSAAGFLFAIVTSVPLVESAALASSSNSYVSTRVQLFHSMCRLDVGVSLYEQRCRSTCSCLSIYHMGMEFRYG